MTTDSLGRQEITSEMIDDVRSQLERVYVVQSEDHGKRSMTFYITPRLSSTSQQIHDIQRDILDKYCYPPHTLWTDITNYRFTLNCL